ncbi:MAG: hypothetical protein HFJ53_04115 [Clostridia bacterium]|jgi:NTE family protein|nr:hypothetical protein [Clostridia bacterium]
MKLGIALSGGGIRGIAHAGVLKALEDNNIKIDIIGGTSAGSLIAALYAMGYSPYYIYILFKRYSKELVEISSGPIVSGISNFMLNKKVSFKGLKSGKSLETIYNQIAYKKGIRKIEQIEMPIVIPTVDIIDSKEYIITNKIPEKATDKKQYITNITVGKAVRASSSFPAVFMPCEFESHAFMDGGTLDNIPVNEVKKQGADKVIAVKFNADQIDEESNIMDIVMKTIDIMGSKISEESLEMSDLVLNVYTDKVGLLDTKKLDSCYKYGYNCVMENIDKIKDMIKTDI